jgi:hypothetical protein
MTLCRYQMPNVFSTTGFQDTFSHSELIKMAFRTFPLCFRLILKKNSFGSQNLQNMKAGKLGFSFFMCSHLYFDIFKKL